MYCDALPKPFRIYVDVEIVSLTHDHFLFPQRDRTALHYAAQFDSPCIVKRLISCGATVDIDEMWDKTPLWLAVCGNSGSCVDLLVGAGADPQHKRWMLEFSLFNTIIAVVTIWLLFSKLEGSPIDVAKERQKWHLLKTLQVADTGEFVRRHFSNFTVYLFWWVIFSVVTEVKLCPSNRNIPTFTPLRRKWRSSWRRWDIYETDSKVDLNVVGLLS